MDSLERFAFGLALAAAVTLVAGHALAGGVTGTVTYEGEVPDLKPINMSLDPRCAELHASAPGNEVLVLGDGNTMGNVLVRVRHGAGGDFSSPGEPAALVLEGCRFVPHVLAMMPDQPVEIENLDGLAHNVVALPRINEGFDLAIPGGGEAVTRTFAEVEPPFGVRCAEHPWMSAYVAVLDNPYHDVTGADGRFVLDDLPPGDYEIEAWHEKLKTKSAKITVEEGETTSVDFTFSAPER